MIGVLALKIIYKLQIGFIKDRHILECICITSKEINFAATSPFMLTSPAIADSPINYASSYAYNHYAKYPQVL